MTSRPWLRQLFGFRFRHQPAARTRCRARPQVESLEDRLAPADYRVTAQLQVLPADIGNGMASRQVVFFESGVADYQILQKGLAAGTDAVVLDGAGDGLAEMAAFLKGRQGLSAIHVVAHGAPGALELGTAVLDEQVLKTRAGQVAALGGALAPHGDLLLWSCDVAAGPRGRTFLRDLADDSGANVAASARPVGTADLGGGWDLKAAAGGVHTAAPFSAASRAAFPTLLAWTAATPLSAARVFQTATLLANGKVLVTGGFGASGSILATAALYDPATDTWSAAAPMSTARVFQTATLLANGKVLVVGGMGTGGELDSAELYDPVRNTWTAAGSLHTARFYHTATLLANGKVLVAAGQNYAGSLSSAELYDPATNTWSAAATLHTARFYHTATLLANGKILVAGGRGGGGYVSGAELYDPASNTWTAAGSLSTLRDLHTAVLLPSGKVLVAGGDYRNGSALASAELYDPVANAWTAAGSLSVARYIHTATPLADGTVLVAGGYDGSGAALTSTERYDPGSNSWSAAGALSAARYDHSATLLANGEVLVAGGYNGSGSALASAELYLPGGGQIAPVITTQPASQTRTVGQAASFTAAASGSPAPGVRWQVSTDGGASFNDLSGATAPTLSFTAALAQSGNQYRAVFTNAAGSVISNAATLTVTPAAASNLVVSGFPTPVTAGDSTHRVTVTAYDAYGDVATGYTGTVHFTSSDGHAGLPADATLTNGTGSFGVTLLTAGVESITAADTVTGSLTGTQTGITVTPAAASTLRVTGFPIQVTAGDNTNRVTVTAYDAYGNVATGYSGTVHITSSDGRAALPADAPLANGSGTFGVTLFTAGAQSITAADSGAGSLTGTQSGITVMPAAASSLAVSGFPTSVTAGDSTHQVTVTAYDAYGNVATGYAGRLHFTSSDGQAALPADAPLSNGTGSFGVTLFTAGTRSITATDTAAGSLTGAQAGITVTPAAASIFRVYGFPTPVTAGDNTNRVTVTAYDAYGNVAAGYAGTVHFTSSDGRAALPADTTLSNGTGTFGVTLFTAGVQSVTAVDTLTSSLTGTQTGITVTPAAASTLVVSGFPAPVTAGDNSNLVTVTARDAYGNVATGYSGTVHFTSSDGRAALPADSTLTNGTGTFGVTLFTAGVQSITAADTVTGSLTGTQSGITVTPAAASTLVVGGFPAQVTAGDSTHQVTVTAYDAYGNVATGYGGTVHFTSSDPQAALPADATLTSGTGTFGVTLFTAGIQSIIAADTAVGSLTGTQAGITVAPAAASQLRLTISASMISGMAYDLTVTALDAYGNVDVNYAGTVTFTTTDTGPGVMLPPNYAFGGTDAGMAFLPGGVTLMTPGSLTLTVTDTLSGISGTAAVLVTSS